MTSVNDGSTYVLSGISSILNQDNIKSGIDLKDLETKMKATGMAVNNTNIDLGQQYLKELEVSAAQIGITMKDLQPQSDIFSDLDAFNSGASDTPKHSSSVDPPPKYSDPPSSSSYTSSSSSSYTSSSTPDDTEEDAKRYYGSSLSDRTAEQSRREHIDSVMTPAHRGFSFETEKKEDEKNVMLAEIDNLISLLEEDDVDLSRIPKVDRSSEFSEVESVLKILRHKNDNARYCSFAEEFLIFGAIGLEELFNGERSWMGYKPDLSGWSNHVNVKLKRMRHDTSTIVSEIMEYHGVSPLMRILLELIPSAAIHSRRQSERRHEKPFSEDDMKQYTDSFKKSG